MRQLIASLKSGNWKALLACFCYFDTGFTAWVMFGPLAPFISKQLSLSPSQSGFLVAVPVLAASIVRVTFGNLFQSVDGCRLALLGISLSAIPAFVLLLPVVSRWRVPPPGEEAWMFESEQGPALLPFPDPPHFST
jgi:MFS transporter, NNP family, nitrate/nitrite transporter